MKSMMKRSTLREIRHTLGRFMAILAITALGVGFFSGVRVTTPAMVSMMNSFLREKNLYDLRLLSTVGWDAENAAAFAKLPGVKSAEGGITADMLFTLPEGETVVMKTHLLPDQINGIQLTDGRLPRNANEVLADSRCGLRLGQVLTLSPENNADTQEMLKETEWKVVGLGQSSLYINFERGNTSLGSGSVRGFLYLPKTAYEDGGLYTELFVRFSRPGDIYTDAYRDYIDAHTDAIEALAETESEARLERLTKESRDKIDKGRSELERRKTTGQEELDEAGRELDDVNKQLRDAKDELHRNERKLNEGKAELDASSGQIEAGRRALDSTFAELDAAAKSLADTDRQLSEGERQLTEGQKQLDAAAAELDVQQTALDGQRAVMQADRDEFYEEYGELVERMDTLPEIYQRRLREMLEQLSAGEAELAAAQAQLDVARKGLSTKQSELDGKRQELETGRTAYRAALSQYEQGRAQYDAAVAEFSVGETAYNEAKAQYDEGRAAYDKGMAEYEDGMREYTEAMRDYEQAKRDFKTKIAEAEQKIADGERELADLDTPETYVLGRNTNIGYACFESDSEIVGQVARVFPIFFILVAALVCMTTMSRMVEEQRTQIGVFKALGYSSGTIMGRYMFYAGAAAVTGCIAGFLLGTKLFPAIIWVTYKLMYIPLSIPYLFDWKLGLAALGVSLVCSVGTTWLSCRYALSETAADLMRPKAPKAGKRVLLEYLPFLWKRMPFLHKVSARNIFRYKGRFFMMVLGIGGCMALLLTGFGIKDSIAGFAETQYNEIQTADVQLNFREEDAETVRALLDEQAEAAQLLRVGSWDLYYGDHVKSIDLVAAEDFSAMGDFMHFRDADGEALPAPGRNEALVSHSVAERYGAAPGTEILLRDADMRELRLTVAGVFENHVYNYVFVSMETCAEQLGEDVQPNSAYANLKGDDLHAAAAALSGDEAVTTLTLFEDTKIRMSNMMSSLDYIVLLVIICAAGLGFIVIYNLTNINITERTREIATIKVLGFFRRETSAYVLRENLTLTALGAAVGVGLGVLLHRFVMAQIVVDLVDFRVCIQPLSYLWSVLLTFVFNGIVDLVMERKLEQINMAESLKSVD